MKKNSKKRPWYHDFFGHDYFRLDRQEKTVEEVNFLEKTLILQPGSRILDLCCGYGRHSLELAKRGYNVVGLDLSEPLLKKAKQKSRKAAVHWIRGDMRKIPLKGPFDTCISLFTSFGYLQGEDENFRVLGEIASLLSKQGTLFLDLVNRDYILRNFQRKEWYEKDGLLMVEERGFDLFTGRWTAEATVREANKERRYDLSVRLYTLTELQMLLQAAGLRVLHVFGDFDGELYSWDSPRMIITAEKI